MNTINVSEENLEQLVIGGAILGGGGGGSIQKGLSNSKSSLELGNPEILNVDDLKDEAIVITVSNVGAPAAKNQFVNSTDYTEVIKLLEKHLDTKIDAIVTNENGGSATVNGLLQSVTLGIPLVDAPCNGRAHPTGTMGALGLNELEDYNSVQASIGGEPNTKFRINQVVEGNIYTVSQLTRNAADLAGGLVTVARNPVTGKYIKENAAIGAISQALEIGKLHSGSNEVGKKIQNVVDYLGGIIICEGKVTQLELKTVNGFDVGSLILNSECKSYYLTFWNEYMNCDEEGTRISTFPDLIMTFDSETGMPVTSAEIKKDDKLTLISVPYSNLKLGKGMYSKNHYLAIEKTLHIDIIKYIKDLFKDDK